MKPATAINVRHILCEKHSRATEALEKIQVSAPGDSFRRSPSQQDAAIQGGERFDKVAQEYSEDKAKGDTYPLLCIVLRILSLLS